MNGVTLSDVLDVCRTLRGRGVTTPIVGMGYYNPILSYGLERFAKDAAEAGLDGLIPVDVPYEEVGPLKQAFDAHGLDVVVMLAPTSTDERIARTLDVASGFVYCVSVTGTTGVRGDLPEDLAAIVERVKRHTSVPVAVGFGCRGGSMLRELASYAKLRSSAAPSSM